MNLRFFSTMLLVFGLVSCAAVVGRFEPKPSLKQQARFVDGAPVIFSYHPTSVVALGPAGATVDPSARLQFTVMLWNEGLSPVLIGPESVSVVADDGKILKVYSAEQLEREARQKATRARVASALSAFGNSMSAANAGYTSSSGTVHGTESTYGGSRPNSTSTFAGSYAGSTYNSAAAAQAQAQANAANQQLIARTNAQVAEIMSRSQSGALQRTTVDPGGNYFSPVTADKMPSGAKSLTVRVTVGAEVHEFAWTYQSE